MIIGILGLAGSGKDTAADFLVRGHGFAKVAFADPLKRILRDVYDFSNEQLWGPSGMRNAPDVRYPRKHTWADSSNDDRGLYDCVCCGAKCRRGWEPDRACALTPRYALQQLGTEWGRHCFHDTWLDYAIRVAEKLSVEGGYVYDAGRGLEHTWHPGDDNWHTDVVIPDVRFKNEVEKLKAHGVRLIRLVRPNAGLSGSAGMHVSEAEQASIPDEMFDAVIQNNATVTELCEAVNMLALAWKEGV